MMVDTNAIRENLLGPAPRSLGDDEVLELCERVRELKHLARCAGDFRDQIHPDVNWDRVPPWTMATTERLDDALAEFDKSDV